MGNLFTMRVDNKFYALMQSAQSKLGADSGAEAIRRALQAIVDEKQVIFHCQRHNFGTAMTLTAHDHWLQHEAEKAQVTP